MSYVDYRNAGVARPRSVSVINVFTNNHGQRRLFIYGGKNVGALAGQLDVLFLDFE